MTRGHRSERTASYERSQGADARVRFDARGVLDAFPLISAAECDAVVRDALACGPVLSWHKGLHEFDSACSRVARLPRLVEIVTGLLGEDVILWAAQNVSQQPGGQHRWHADAEAMAWPTVNVWIGLRNVGANSFLSILEGSHSSGVAPQDLDPAIDLLDDEQVVMAALGRRSGVERRDLEMEVGEALVFDGRLWHASRTPGSLRRSALLLQYSPASAVPKILAGTPTSPTWEERPPACLLVAGARSRVDAANVIIDRQRRVPGALMTSTRRVAARLGSARRRMGGA